MAALPPTTLLDIFLNGVFLAVLPADFDLPGLAVLVPLALVTAAVALALYHRRPSVDESTALAFGPWMAAGGALRVLQGFAGLPEPVLALLGTPTVYLTVFVLAASTWTLLDWRVSDRTASGIAVAGTLLAVVAGGTVLLDGARRDALALVWPGLAVLAAVSVTLLVAAGDRWRSGAPGLPSAWIGLLVIFGHALDGTSTAVGVDVFGATERTPIPRAILEFSSGLPTAEVIGIGWLFVLVKIAVALVVLQFVRELVHKEPTQGYLLLTFVTAVGLGPGVHNVLLFATSG
jgi:uncharacterized membrane protein